MPPLTSPAPTPAVEAGCHAREISPAPKLPEIRPTATVFPAPFVRGTIKVLFTAYFMRGQVPCRPDGWYRRSSWCQAPTPNSITPLIACWPRLDANRLPKPAAPPPHSPGRFLAWPMPAETAEPAIARGRDNSLPSRFKSSREAAKAEAVNVKTRIVLPSVRISEFPLLGRARTMPVTAQVRRV